MFTWVRYAIISTHDGTLSIGLFEIYFSEIWFKFNIFIEENELENVLCKL